MDDILARNKRLENTVGIAKTVLVSIEGPAVISAIVVRKLKFNESERLVFGGVVSFNDELKSHIRNDVLPHIDEILTKISLPLDSYEISATNIGAVSSEDEGFSIYGYSADIAIFIAVLSVSLQIPISQNTVFTGHISSISGDICQVKGLTEKINVASIDKEIIEFIYPELENDQSYKLLKPKDYENVLISIRNYREVINLVEVIDTFDFIQKVFSKEFIALSSLKFNFFYQSLSFKGNQNSDKIVMFLTNDNSDRFWNSLKHAFMNQKIETVHDLLETYSQYFLAKSNYPPKYGQELSNLLQTIPTHLIKINDLFPLINPSLYLDIIKLATIDDQHDLNELYNAINGTIKNMQEYGVSTIDNIDNGDIVNLILHKLGREYIEVNITRPLDDAILNYYNYENKVQNYEEFLESITNFYSHIQYYLNPEMKGTNYEKARIESYDLIKKTYPSKNELKGIIYNAISGLNGGLRTIYNTLIIYLKDDLRRKHILGIISQYIEPLNFEQKKSIVSEILMRERNNLSIDQDLLKPEKYVDDLFEILVTYSNSKESFSQIFNKF